MCGARVGGYQKQPSEMVEQDAHRAGKPFSGDATLDRRGHAIERRRVSADSNGGAPLHGLHLDRRQPRIGIGKRALPAAPRRDRRYEGLDEAVHRSEAPRRVHAAERRLGIARSLAHAWASEFEFVVFGFEERRIVLRFGEMVQAKDLRRAVPHDMPIDSGGAALWIGHSLARPHKSHRNGESRVVERRQRPNRRENSARKRAKPCGQSQPRGCNRDGAIENRQCFTRRQILDWHNAIASERADAQKPEARLLEGLQCGPFLPGGGFAPPDQPVNHRTAAQRGGKRRELQSQYQGVRDKIGGAGVTGIEVCPREPLTGCVLYLWFGGEGHGFDAEPGDQVLQAPGMVQRVWRSGGARASCGHLRQSSEINQLHASSTGLPAPRYAYPFIHQNSCPECAALAAPSCGEVAGLADLESFEPTTGLVHASEGNP